MRIGLFGGTFNPVHSGHVQVVLDIGCRFDLDRIYFIPCAIPPHKDPGQIADSNERLTMVQLAVSEHDGLFVSDVELKRGGLSYTIHTLEYFREQYPKEAELFFLLGIDAFLEVDTWHSWDRLFTHCSFIVMPRHSEVGNAGIDEKERVLGYLKQKISCRYEYDAQEIFFTDKNKGKIYLSDVDRVDLSSTMIRELIKTGGDISSMTPPKVAQYIKTRGLYK